MKTKDIPWGLCEEGAPAHRCRRITGDGRRCMYSGHGRGPRYADGLYEETSERPIPLDTVTHGAGR